jgi:hypothetical protein
MSINTPPNLHDILAEPSVEVLTGYARDYNVPRGKFIRIGKLIVVAPKVVLAKTGKEPMHIKMMWAAFHNPDEAFAEKCHQALQDADSAQALPRHPDLMDAGHYTTTLSPAGLLLSVTLERDSMDFGRADTVGRQETVQIMQDYLQSPDIAVTGS